MIKLTNITGNITDATRGLIINATDCMDEREKKVYGKWDISGATGPLSGEGMGGLAHIIVVSNDIYVANCYITNNNELLDRDKLNHCIESAVAFADCSEYEVHIPYETWVKVGPSFLLINTKYNTTINIYNVEEEI